MTKLEKFFTKKRLILIGILWVFTNILFHFGPWGMNELEKVSGGKGIPDLMTEYDLDTLYQLFTAYGDEGIRIYKNLQIIDFVYPLIYGSLLLGLLVRLQINMYLKFLLSFPFAIVFFDYSENLIIRHLINKFPDISEKADGHLANLASLCTTIKWAQITAVLFGIILIWLWKYVIKPAYNHIKHSH